MQRKLIAAFAALTATFSFTAVADTSSEDALDYRKAVMTALRGHIGASSMIARGLIEDDGHLLGHAQGLASGAAELGRVFQEGSNVGESEALPAIWEDAEGFAEAVASIQTAADAFVEAAETGDATAIGAAFRNVGMGCRGCHDKYRQQD
ncbi:MAG: cytochrome c [Pseudomonadota bacterium]|nr:cytochrome c [Pseudomonadota bacterium]